MDCKLAQQLLALQRTTGPSELHRDDVGALNAHLGTCASCSLDARLHSSFDAAMAKVMRSVTIPAGAKDRVLNATLTKQSALHRRKWITVAGIAATVILAVGVPTGVFYTMRPVFDTHQLAWSNERFLEAPEQSTQRWLESQNLPTTAPIELEYFNYLCHGKRTLQGREVPFVTFAVHLPNTKRIDTATMYVITDSQFNFKNLRDDQTSLYSVSVTRDPAQPGVAWVFVYTTATIDPFRKVPPRPTT